MAEVLPQLDGEIFLSDGGIETYLVFDRGIDLPEFSAFVLLKDETGTRELRDYYVRYLTLAEEAGLGYVLESPTWRANPKWGAAIGYSEEEVADANRRAIELMRELRDAHPGLQAVVISGCVGPHDDGYAPGEILSADEAIEFHSSQVGTFAEAGVDQVTAITMTYVDEAIGVARAAKNAGVPVAISFTVETDGRLPSGQSLGEAIEEVDADTGTDVAYYMINCAHPTHFDDVIAGGGDWLERIRGLRANASTMSHAELDEAEELDSGDPEDLAARYAALRERMPQLTVMGGCCGTDHRHIEAIREAVAG